MEGKKLIIDMIERIKKLGFRDEVELDAIKRRPEMLIRNLFGEDSKYLKD